MKNELNLPAAYAVLSEEEMTYTEGGAISVFSGLVAVSSAIGFGVLGSSYLWGIQQAKKTATSSPFWAAPATLSALI